MNYIVVQIEGGWSLKVYGQESMVLVYQVCVSQYRDALRLINWIEENNTSNQINKLFVA